MKKNRGYTVIEMLVTVAIIGIILALAAGSWGSIGDRGSVRNAANDFHSALLNARQRAIERQTDVWVVIYPYINRAGVNDSTNNSGAYFIVQDSKDLSFETYYKDTFNPPGAIGPPAANGTLIEEVWLQDYPRKNARFLKNNIAGAYKAPFNTLTAAGCSFCDGPKTRGAVVFSGDGFARFLKNNATEDTTKTVSLSISSFKLPLENVFLAVTGPTGFVTMYP